MKKNNLKNIIITSSLFLLFIIFTILTKIINVENVGPENSEIGFAKINTSIYQSITPNEIWDKLADIIMIVAIGIVIAFMIIGFIQLIKRKNLFKVDKEILFLGVIYILIICCYIAFELFVINYRPTLINGELEASFPSTHTLIVSAIMATGVIFTHRKINNKLIKILIDAIACICIIVVSISRILSGMHWITDVIAALLLTTSITMLYYTLITLKNNSQKTKIEAVENTPQNEN